MVPVAAPPRVRDRLRTAPDGPVPVVHRGERAVYVDVAGWCVGVVAADATQVPCALRLAPGRRFPDSPDSGPVTAYLGGGTLHLGGTPLPVGRLVGASVPGYGRGDLPRTMASPVTDQVLPPTEVAGFVAAHLPGRRVDAGAVPRILGRGDGLTPLGDDLLAGWLAMHRAAGVPTADVDAAVREHSPRTTLLSATLLDCALHGEVLPEYAAWVRSLGTPDEPRRVRALHRVGATSGAGLHLGGRIALDQIRGAA